MKYVETTKATDIDAQGIVSVELEQVGPSVKTITFLDTNGVPLVKITASYGIDVLVPAPPVYKDAYRVSGILAGVRITELYADSYTADRRVRELAGVSETGDFKSTKIKALEDVPVRTALPSECPEEEFEHDRVPF